MLYIIAIGAWQSGVLELVVPGPSAKAFHSYFIAMMKEDRQPELRAGHPDHFMNIPLGPRALTQADRVPFDPHRLERELAVESVALFD